jgi:hypothetical protein
MHEEFRLLKDIIRDFMPPDYSYEPEDGDPAVKQSDYDLVDVLPVSDPNASTMAQKVVQYQAVLQLAAGAPQLYDLPLLHRQMLDVLGIKNASKLVPMQDDQRPRDPVTENMDILKGKPVKAFLYQDHQAHIAVHQMAMQDPKVMGLLQQNPNAQGMQAVMMAHINEHLGYEYKKQIEAQIGIQIPDYEDEQTIPEDMETQIAQRAAQASQQLLQQHQMEAQQQQAQRRHQHQQKYAFQFCHACHEAHECHEPGSAQLEYDATEENGSTSHHGRVTAVHKLDVAHKNLAEVFGTPCV